MSNPRGISATGGMGRRNSTISEHECLTKLEEPISTPDTTPTHVATARPSAHARMVSPMLAQKIVAENCPANALPVAHGDGKDV